MDDIFDALYGIIKAPGDGDVRDDDKGNLIGVCGEEGANLGGLGFAAHDEADCVPGFEGAQGDLRADEAGRAGDEDCRHVVGD
jgi:hypothetical protein